MVKTFEEERSNLLDEKRFNILCAIFFRYIHDAYKQFKWTKAYIGEGSGESILRGYKPLLGASSTNLYVREGEYDSEYILKIDITNKVSGVGCIYSFLPSSSHLSYEEMKDTVHQNMIRIEQNFPVSGSMKPKELGKLAQNIFKWVKEQMKKIPD